LVKELKMVTLLSEVTIVLYLSPSDQDLMHRIDLKFIYKFQTFQKKLKNYGNPHIFHLVFWETYVLFRKVHYD
jgi:hypothetical protein